MADLSDSVNWSETDSSNNKASPNGWPEGMMPSGVNDSARADKGALKRFWDRINPVQVITPSAGIYTFLTANPAYPVSYIDGEVYWFKPSVSSIGADQFRVNALPAKPIWKRINAGTGFVPLVAGDISFEFPTQLVYDGGLNGGAGVFVLVNPFLPVIVDGAGGISMPGPIYTTGGSAAFSFAARDGAAPTSWIWYAAGGLARLNAAGSGDRVTIDAAGSLSAFGEVHAAGSLFSGASLYLGSGGSIYFNGVVFATSDGTTSHIYDGTGGNAIHLQAGINYYDADIHQFRTNGGVVSAAIHNDWTTLTGDVYAPMLRGGLGQDVGVLRMAPTGVDPSPHTVFFGWDALGEAFYRVTDSTVALLVSSGGSGNVRSVFLQVDGGAPSGWHLAVQQGTSNFYIFVDFTSSDARMKRGIADSKVDALAAICAVPVRRFEWRKEVQALFGVPQGPVAIGLVAQDLLPHMPDCVGISEGRDKPYPADTHTIMHDRIDAYVIRAIQQLEARIAQLETK